MTWYATEVLAQCNEALLSAVMKEPKLAACAYLISEPIGYRLNETECVFHPPPAGLLVLRPVCDPDSHCASWHDGDVVSWHDLSAPADTRALSPESFGGHIDHEISGDLPPASFFRYLKKLSEETKADLAFFHCFMWGGDTELEYAWLFGRREEAGFVLKPGVESEVAKVHAAGKVEIVEVDLLSDVLAYLGAPIHSPYCVMHIRDFPWERFKILRSGNGRG